MFLVGRICLDDIFGLWDKLVLTVWSLTRKIDMGQSYCRPLRRGQILSRSSFGMWPSGCRWVRQSTPTIWLHSLQTRDRHQPWSDEISKWSDFHSCYQNFPEAGFNIFSYLALCRLIFSWLCHRSPIVSPVPAAPGSAGSTRRCTPWPATRPWIFFRRIRRWRRPTTRHLGQWGRGVRRGQHRCMLWLAKCTRWFLHVCCRMFSTMVNYVLPVVPRKAVAEVSKIGNL